MNLKLIFLIAFLTHFSSWSQSDTINQSDGEGRKQGHWIYYGKDRPKSGCPVEGKVEEGTYKDDRKNGMWTRYYPDGKTIKIRGEYVNNRPNGKFEKYNPEGNIRSRGHFSYSKGGSPYSSEEFNYFDSGQLESKKIHEANYDSTYHYFKSGCLNRISRLSAVDPGKEIITRYRGDSCNQILDTIIELHEIYEYDSKGSIIRESSDCSWGNKVSSQLDDSTWRFRDSSTCLYYTNAYICKDFSNGYIKRYDASSEIIFDGMCNGGHAYNGKFYFYDEDGILERVEVWKNAKFHSVGQL